MQTTLVLGDTPAVCAATPQGSADLDCTQNYHIPNLRIRSCFVLFCNNTQVTVFLHSSASALQAVHQGKVQSSNTKTVTK